MPWMRHKLRDADVWAKVDAKGALIPDAGGRVEIVYKAQPGAKVYRASSRNLTPMGGEPVEIEAGEPAPERDGGDGDKKRSRGGGSSGAGGAMTSAAAAVKVPEGAVHVWTDGACTGNPGPAALGVVVIDGPERKELGEYLGEGTNNIAELTAIERGLAMVRDKRRPVAVYSDSAYAIGLLSKNWKPKANVELVGRIRALTSQFDDLRFVKVKGHAGIPENERCDELARTAILTRSRSLR
jgi:ribonuclease HI